MNTHYTRKSILALGVATVALALSGCGSKEEMVPKSQYQRLEAQLTDLQQSTVPKVVYDQLQQTTVPKTEFEQVSRRLADSVPKPQVRALEAKLNQYIADNERFATTVGVGVLNQTALMYQVGQKLGKSGFFTSKAAAEGLAEYDKMVQAQADLSKATILNGGVTFAHDPAALTALESVHNNKLLYQQMRAR